MSLRALPLSVDLRCVAGGFSSIRSSKLSRVQFPFCIVPVVARLRRSTSGYCLSPLAVLQILLALLAKFRFVELGLSDVLIRLCSYSLKFCASLDGYSLKFCAILQQYSLEFCVKELD